MIVFNDLRISDDKSQIILDIEIEDASTTNSGMYISGIYLDYYKNLNEVTTYSTKALKVYEYEEDGVKIAEYAEPILQSSLSLDANGVNTFENGLFFLIVRCTDDTNSVTEIAAVLDWSALYCAGMNHIARFAFGCADRCEVPADVEHFVLLYHALNFALQTGNLAQIIKLWSRFIGAPGLPANGANCNCR